MSLTKKRDLSAIAVVVATALVIAAAFVTGSKASAHRSDATLDCIGPPRAARQVTVRSVPFRKGIRTSAVECLIGDTPVAFARFVSLKVAEVRRPGRTSASSQPWRSGSTSSRTAKTRLGHPPTPALGSPSAHLTPGELRERND